MEVYIGGYAQGKLAYVKQVHSGEDLWVAEDCAALSEKRTGRLVLNGMHRMIRELLEEGQDPQAFFEGVFDQYPDCIVICDEVGNGIVPVDQKERKYRDKVGEILILAAEKAGRVERVICGLGQRIK